MAIVTRVNGDAAGVTNVDAGRSFANAAIINAGIAAPLGAYKIVMTNGNLAAELTTGGAVETVLRSVAANATVLAYQVDSNFQISVLTERSAWSAADLQTVIQGLAANIGATGNCYAGPGVTVTTASGIKIA